MWAEVRMGRLTIVMAICVGSGLGWDGSEGTRVVGLEGTGVRAEGDGLERQRVGLV